MRILFSPVGYTDPVRGYHDGPLLHILRHYEVDKVFLILTETIEENEEKDERYTKGIRDVSPNTEIVKKYTHIKNPQEFEVLAQMQDIFDDLYRENSKAEWLINISSATPQIETVMALLAIDYPNVKAIQVKTPVGASNKDNPNANDKDVFCQMEHNKDKLYGAENRCEEPPLYILRRHGLVRQIISLVDNYEYDGALQIVRQNQDCGFSEDTKKLLLCAVFRKNLLWKQANNVISDCEEKPLLEDSDDFSEYFRVMEMQKKKEQYSEFIVKLSPVLVQLGMKYLQNLHSFKLSDCGNKYKKGKTFFIDREKMDQAYPDLAPYIQKKFGIEMRNGPLYFSAIVWICKYLKENQYQGDEKHEKVTDIFEKLRLVEGNARNLVAHVIVNLDDNRIRQLTVQKARNSSSMDGGLSSEEIMDRLHEAVRLIYGHDIRWNYDDMNAIIIDSLRKR